MSSWWDDYEDDYAGHLGYGSFLGYEHDEDDLYYYGDCRTDSTPSESVHEDEYDDFPEEDSGSDSSFPSVEPAGEDEGPLRDLAQALAKAPILRDDTSFGGDAKFLPSAPGLVIDGVGTVALPVYKAKKAEAIIKVCEQADPQSSDDTASDSAAQSSWCLDPTKVKVHFKNPKWEVEIRNAAKTIASKLGAGDVPVTVRLSKLHFLCEDSELETHRESKKDDRILARMFIQPPSNHTGGNLLVSHDDETAPLQYDFGQGTRQRYMWSHYAVYAADAAYALTTVTSGYQLALVYDVCRPESTAQEVPTALDEGTKRDITKHLAELSLRSRNFHLCLKHRLGDRAMAEDLGRLGFAALQGQDRSRVSALRAANASIVPHLQFVFFLGFAVREARYRNRQGQDIDNAEWDLDHPISETILDLYTLDRRQLKTDYALREAAVLNPDERTAAQLWHGKRSVEEDVDREGSEDGDDFATKDTRYCKYVLLAVPKHVDVTASLGRGAALYVLEESDPSAEKVEAFLKDMVTTLERKKADTTGPGPVYERWENKSLRPALFNLITGKTEFHKLISYYFQLFSRGSDLVEDDRSDWRKLDTCCADLVELMRDSRFRDELKVCDKIVAAFEGDELNTLRLVGACIKASNTITTAGAPKLDPAAWKGLVDILHRCQSAAPTAEVLSKTDMFYSDAASIQPKLWQVAFQVPDDGKLLGLAVRRFQAVDPASLKGCIDVLHKCATGSTLGSPSIRQFDSRRELIKPLLRARATWLEKQGSAAEKKERDAELGRIWFMLRESWQAAEGEPATKRTRTE
ncbi:hypothetical protein V8E36_005908 [Tilletia maclaganii]